MHVLILLAALSEAPAQEGARLRPEGFRGRARYALDLDFDIQITPHFRRLPPDRPAPRRYYDVEENGYAVPYGNGNGGYGGCYGGPPPRMPRATPRYYEDDYPPPRYAPRNGGNGNGYYRVRPYPPATREYREPY